MLRPCANLCIPWLWNQSALVACRYYVLSHHVGSQKEIPTAGKGERHQNTSIMPRWLISGQLTFVGNMIACIYSCSSSFHLQLDPLLPGKYELRS